MRRTLPDDDDHTFDEILLGATSSLWRFEQQRRYAVDDEDALFSAFRRRGELIEPTQAPGLRAWYQQVREWTMRGVQVARVRVVDSPPTDYQRWLQALDRWNRAAGEVIEYLPRWALAANEAGMMSGQSTAPFGDNDWWLADDSTAIVMTFDGHGMRTSVEVVDGSGDSGDELVIANAVRFATRSMAAAVALRKEAASRAAA